MRRAHSPLNQFDGFRFSPSSEQNDLDSAEYGTTIVSVEYVLQHIPPDCRLLHFSEAEWEGYQDAYVLSKNPCLYQIGSRQVPAEDNKNFPPYQTENEFCAS